MRAVTLQDIADRCGVTKMTVSRALHGDTRNVSMETSARIKAVALELGYDPSFNHAARRLALRKCGQDVVNHLVAMFFPSGFQQWPYYTTIFGGMLEVFMPEKFSLLTHYTSFAERASENALPPVFMRGDVDGAIISRSSAHTQWICERLRATAFAERPIVSVITPVEGCSAVLIEAELSGYLAANHLLDLGHRHIIHMEAANPPHDQRMCGICRAYEERGLDPHAHLVYAQWFFDDENATVEAMDAALTAYPRSTAIIAANDRTAVLARDLAHRRGMRVPDDLSLVGFDDVTPMPDALGHNMLTTVRLPLQEVGQQAARLLLQHIRGHRRDIEQITLPVNLIERGSTAPPRV
jgi:LacI family transcriptional regulator